MKKVLAFTLAAFLFLSAEMSAHAEGLKDVFSAKYYADKYPDLYAAFEYDEDKLFAHYLEYGMKEGRSMSPIIDIERYRGKYADLEGAFGNKWDLYANHWYEYGIYELRDDGTRFNPQLYVESYPDLKAAFGTDYAKGAKHYLEYGIYEGRTLGFEPEPQYVTWVAPETEEDSVAPPTPETTLPEEPAFSGMVPTYTGDVLTKETYYENGIIVSETNYDVSGVFIETIVYGYDTVTGNVETKEYQDENGALIKTENLDERGNVIEEIPAGGIPITYTYNAQNQRTSKTEGDITEEYEYHANGVIMTKVVIDNSGSTTRTQYDYTESGFLSKKTNNNGRYEIYHEAPGYALGYWRIDYYLSNGTIYETANYNEAGEETGRYGYDQG